MDSFTVRRPKLEIWVGVLGAAFWSAMLVLMTLYPNDTAAWWVYLEFIAFLLLGIGLAVNGARWKIEAGGGALRITRSLGGARSVLLSEIGAVRPRTGGFVVCAGGKRLFLFSLACPGGGLLLESLQAAGIPFLQ